MQYATDILIVDDCDLDADLVKEAITNLNTNKKCLHFWNGEEALQYLLQAGPFKNRLPIHPKLILLDIQMPKVNGFEVLERINECEGLVNVPVVMMSSSPVAADVNRAYDCGAKSYLRKPYDYKEYIKVVSNTVHYWMQLNEVPY